MQILAMPAFRTKRENPYNWLLYAAIQEMGLRVDEFSHGQLLRHRYNVWHLHWPETPLNHPNRLKAIIKLTLFFVQIAIAKQRGVKLIWTVHNLKSHEGYYPKIEQWFWQQFTQHLDGFISLSQTGLAAAKDRFPALRDKPGFVVPHSHYRGAYGHNISRAQARTELGLDPDDQVLLFFGRIRAYKNVPRLIEVFRQIKGDRIRLVIAGRPEASDRQQLEHLAQSEPRLQLHLDFIDQDRAQVFFQAADLVVLPYREILNSGTALLALSFDCPVLVPDRGAMGELQDLVGHDWVSTFNGDLSAVALQDAVDWSQQQRSETAPLAEFEGSRLAQMTLEAYRAIEK
jgi:beta-1,4-mannosyltransferase